MTNKIIAQDLLNFNAAKGRVLEFQKTRIQTTIVFTSF
jgi:hypothetical protein